MIKGKLLVDGPRNRSENVPESKSSLFAVLRLKRFTTAVFCKIARDEGSQRH